MEINNVWWWVFIVLNISGFFIYKFASIADGTMKEVDKAIGLTMVWTTYLAMFIRFGWISFLVLLFAIPLLVSPFLIIIINSLEDKFFPERIKFRKSHEMTREQYNNIDEEVQKKINSFIKK